MNFADSFNVNWLTVVLMTMQQSVISYMLAVHVCHHAHNTISELIYDTVKLSKVNALVEKIFE